MLNRHPHNREITTATELREILEADPLERIVRVNTTRGEILHLDRCQSRVMPHALKMLMSWNGEGRGRLLPARDGLFADPALSQSYRWEPEPQPTVDPVLVAEMDGISGKEEAPELEPNW